MADAPDIKLCYFGGSGGFISLHLLLLSGKFICDFDINLNLDEIISHQWSIDDAALWKSHETWPQNEKTKTLQTALRKIYFFCNPTALDVGKIQGVTVLVYTDLESQLQLSRYKRASYFFHEQTSLHKNYVSWYRHKLQLWIKHYNNIKDDSWPRCTGPGGFKQLPSWIQQELLGEPHTLSLLGIPRWQSWDQGRIDQKMLDLRSNPHKILPDSTVVTEPVGDFYHCADRSIKLQNIINDPGTLAALTGTPWNYKQKKLRQQWIDLHPPALLQTIGINHCN